MDRSHHLGYHGVAHLVSKTCQFVFRRAHHLRNQWYAGTRQDVAHRLWRHIAVLFNTIDDFVEPRYVNTIKLHLRRCRLRCVHNLRQGSGQRHLVREVYVSFLQKFSHLWAGSVQTRQNGEDRLLTLQYLLVQHLVSLIELRQPWCAIDDGNGIDVLKFMFTIVNSYAKLFRCPGG